jgi:hypothetical protein
MSTVSCSQMIGLGANNLLFYYWHGHLYCPFAPSKQGVHGVSRKYSFPTVHPHAYRPSTKNVRNYTV